MRNYKDMYYISSWEGFITMIDTQNISNNILYTNLDSGSALIPIAVLRPILSLKKVEYTREFEDEYKIPGGYFGHIDSILSFTIGFNGQSIYSSNHSAIKSIDYLQVNNVPNGMKINAFCNNCVNVMKEKTVQGFVRSYNSSVMKAGPAIGNSFLILPILNDGKILAQIHSRERVHLRIKSKDLSVDSIYSREFTLPIKNLFD